ncbi:MAG: hypothetical protein ACK4HF_14005 [Paracoccaceae bacterium]
MVMVTKPGSCAKATCAEPICRVLENAPSTYYAVKAVERDPDLASDRAKQDQLDMAAIKEAFEGSRGRYGSRKGLAPAAP